MAISLLFNAPLEEGANPSVTPSPVKAPWFLVGMQELLSWGAPFFFGVLVPNVMIVMIILIPYMDRGREGIGVWFHPSRRKANIIFTAVVTVYSGSDCYRAVFAGSGLGFLLALAVMAHALTILMSFKGSEMKDIFQRIFPFLALLVLLLFIGQVWKNYNPSYLTYQKQFKSLLIQKATQKDKAPRLSIWGSAAMD